jgi:hypothetical protein
MITTQARLHRTLTDGHGTLGRFWVGGFQAWMLEPRWRDNAPNISCIPAGTYDVVPRKSVKYGRHYHILNVPGRSWILQHAGNLAGDLDAGLRTHTAGCQLSGDKHGHMNNQRAVFNSRATLDRLIRHLGWRPYRLIITNRF